MALSTGSKDGWMFGWVCGLVSWWSRHASMHTQMLISIANSYLQCVCSMQAHMHAKHANFNSKWLLPLDVGEWVGRSVCGPVDHACTHVLHGKDGPHMHVCTHVC